MMIPLGLGAFRRWLTFSPSSCLPWPGSRTLNPAEPPLLVLSVSAPRWTGHLVTCHSPRPRGHTSWEQLHSTCFLTQPGLAPFFTATGVLWAKIDTLQIRSSNFEVLVAILTSLGGFPAQNRGALAHRIAHHHPGDRCLLVSPGHMYRTPTSGSPFDPGDSGRPHNPPQGTPFWWAAWWPVHKGLYEHDQLTPCTSSSTCPGFAR